MSHTIATRVGEPMRTPTTSYLAMTVLIIAMTLTTLSITHSPTGNVVLDVSGDTFDVTVIDVPSENTSVGMGAITGGSEFGIATVPCTSVGSSGTITASTVLNDSLTAGPGATCITFGASNIFLDCAGFSIIGIAGSGGIGVTATTRTNITVRNCEIYNFRYGIYADFISASKFSNNTLRNNLEWGTAIGTGSNTNLINDSQYFQNSVGGIYLFTNNFNNSIAQNNITNNSMFGVFMNNSHHNTIAYNNITMNRGNGVGIAITARAASTNNVIYNNTISNHSTAIEALTSSNNQTIRNNTINNHTVAINLTGVSISNAYGNWIRNDTIAHADTDDASNEFDWNSTSDIIGNFWDDVPNLAISDSNGNEYGDTGAQYPYKLANSAFVLGSVEDDGPIVSPGPVLSMNVTATPEPVDAGATITFQVSINISSNTAYNTSVTFAYSPSVTFSSASPTSTGDGTEFLLGNLTPGSYTINITATVSSSASGSITDSANISLYSAIGTKTTSTVSVISTVTAAAAPPSGGGGGGGGGCTDECKIGEDICGGSGRYVCAKMGVCTKYVLSPCDTGEVCSKGKCVACPESWLCDAWGPCIAGVQERACFDTAGCGTTRSAPITTKACEILPIIELPSPITPVTYGEVFAGTPVTCAVGSDGTPTTSLSATTSSLDVSAAVPAGFTAISSPFKLACAGETVDITLAVSDSYSDYKVLKCAAGTCEEVAIDETSHLGIPCGATTIGAETEKKETAKDTIFLPSEVTVFPTEFVSVTESSISKGPYSLFIDGVASARLSEASDPIPAPANPSLVILGNPLVVELENAKGPLPATITMPAHVADSVDKNTLAIFVLDGTSWRVLDSTVQDSGVITAKTADITSLLKAGHAVFAVMGATCNPCEGTEFNKVYASPGARTAVVLVHGAFSDASTFNFMVEDLKANRAPFDAWTFEYPATKSVEELAGALAEALATHASQYDEIDVIGHSAGGLITQQALWNAYTQGQDIHKVKKVILVGTPSGGSPAVETVDRMFNWLINQRTVAKLFNVHSDLIQASVTGQAVPRVPGIDYRVIAGTRPYGFNLDLFTDPSGQVLKNDGLITVTSAQKVGDGRVNNSCANFYELNLTHTDLIDNELGIRVAERIISSDSPPDVKTRAGYTTYVTVPIEACSPEDQYLVVGKELRDEKRYDPSGCACGNGWCGDGEDALSCPGDCADVFTLEALCVTSSFLKIILTIAALSIATVYIVRRWLRRKEMRLKWLYVGEAFVLFALAIVLLLSGVCAERPWFWVLLLVGIGLVYIVLLLLERRRPTLPKFPMPSFKPAAPVAPAPALPKSVPISIPPVKIPKIDAFRQRRPVWPEMDAEHHPERPHIDAHKQVESADSALDVLRRKFAREPAPVKGGKLGASHKEVRNELDELNKELAELRRKLKK